ncbi:thiaminase II [Labilibaculum euxinus]
MDWSTKAWESIEEIYTQILNLSFIKELTSGTLEREKFNFYLEQDSIYLAEFGKVLAGIACKLDKLEHRKIFLSFALDTVAVEQALHQFYLQNRKKVVEASPSCLLYTCYIHKQLAATSIEEAVAAILPCFWIYKKVGDYILENQISGENQYQNWIDTYGGDEFSEAVELAIEICNELAKGTTICNQNKMIDAFVMASKLEWMFWKSAYEMEEWPAKSNIIMYENIQ